MELLMVSSENKVGKYIMNKKKNMDDEYTPGIFDVVEIMSPDSSHFSSGGFIQVNFETKSNYLISY